ncbi:MAG: NUDIX domain-containing protein [archaeon]|jgi:isopentenyldiphosphate isomerase
MVGKEKLKTILIWLGQKPKKNSKKHVYIYDYQDLTNYSKKNFELHPYYNAKGKLAGYATRKSLRNLNLISKAAHVFVFNKKGELFLQRRAPTKDLYPNLIAPSASGHVDINETSKQAAVRELKEELGVHQEPLFLGKIKCFTPQLKEFLDVFILITDSKITINKTEISEGFFIPFEEIYTKQRFSEYIPAMKKELRIFKTQIKKKINQLKKEE